MEDKIDMARERLGLAVWEELSEAEQQKFLAMEIWKAEGYDKFIAEQKSALEQHVAKKSKGKKQAAKLMRKRGKFGAVCSNDEDEDMYEGGYVE